MPEAFYPPRASFGQAVNDFFGRRPVPVQPFDFPHNVHVALGTKCVECHAGVTRGPVAGIPGVRTCMTCHEYMGTEHPIIKELAVLRDRGIDVSWQRVYGYAVQAHVRFNHAPHIRSGVECATCHGAIDKQTVAQRNVDLNMRFCVTCHQARDAPIDCLTCHY